MFDSLKQFGLRAVRGEDQTLLATLTRATAAVVEPFYSAAMHLRNNAYDRGIFTSHDLGRPTISVGNITTGGTGKTPVVQWLANQLLQTGHHPAILLRGYGSNASHGSDEAQLLSDSLNIPVQANPSRIAGAAAALRQHPLTDVFILDDAFQHRRAKRDFNLVLISATQPFGFGHVLPRGLLREPLSGLRRADAFAITRCSLVEQKQISEIEHCLQHHSPSTPVFYCDHHLASMWMPGTGERFAMESLAGEKVFLTAGIGDPAAFGRQVESTGCRVVQSRWFEDHHAFTAGEMNALVQAARSAGANRVITTAKDWVKMKSHIAGLDASLLMGVIDLEIRFRGTDGSDLLRWVERLTLLSPLARP